MLLQLRCLTGVQRILKDSSPRLWAIGSRPSWNLSSLGCGHWGNTVHIFAWHKAWCNNDFHGWWNLHPKCPCVADYALNRTQQHLPGVDRALHSPRGPWVDVPRVLLDAEIKVSQRVIALTSAEPSQIESLLKQGCCTAQRVARTWCSILHSECKRGQKIFQ